MNLTCGRNPWKRASTEDSTFRAYLRDPGFLSTILPLSPELDAILRRIFECDPVKRITIPELRELIVRCPRFTTRSNALPPPSPPISEVGDYQKLACYDETVAAAAAAVAQAEAESYQPILDPCGVVVVAPPSPPYTAPSRSHLRDVEFGRKSSSSSSSTSSDADSVFSSVSSASSTMSSNVGEPALFKATPSSPFSYLPLQPNFCGNFLLPALDLVGRHLTPQACAFGVRVH